MSNKDNCNCIERIDKKLNALPSPHTARLVLGISTVGLPPITYVLTEREKGKKITYLAASFCPFCGVRYKQTESFEAQQSSGATPEELMETVQEAIKAKGATP